MPPLPHIDELFEEAFRQRERMLAVEFGGRSAELLPPKRSFLACRLELTERISEPFRAVVYGITPEIWSYPDDKMADDREVEPHPDRFLGQVTSIRVFAGGRTRWYRGVVTAARHLGNWFVGEVAGYDVFELVVEAPLKLLDLRRASRVYPERAPLEVLHEILDEHNLFNETVGGSLRAAFARRGESLGARRACRMQYQESDLEFIHRLLIDEGLSYTIVPNDDAGGFGSSWCVFGTDHDFGQTIDAVLSTAPGTRHLPLIDWRGRRKLVPAYTRTVSHDYKANRRHEAKAEGRKNYGMGRRARGDFGDDESLLPKAASDGEAGMARLAEQRQWAHDMEAEVFEGQTTAPLELAKPIRVLGLDDGRISFRGTEPEAEVAQNRDANRIPERNSYGDVYDTYVEPKPPAYCDDYIVVAQTIVATAPLNSQMRETWRSLASQARQRAGVELFAAEGDDAPPPFLATFEVQPWGKPLVPMHPRHAKRPVPGPMTATVVGPENSVVATDALGRIAVVFHWERPPALPHFQSNYRTFPEGPPVRVRYVHPGAGEGMGVQCLPRVGDEVLILFIDNDIDRPIAVGSLHNGHKSTPSFGGVSSLPKDAALTGMRTGEHRGGGANELVFDDTAGEVGLRLGSTTAGTDLSLGQIATPRQGGEAVGRGVGAELRTEGAAALRASQGMLLTTHSAPPSAPHLQHEGLTALLASCKQLLGSIEAAIERNADIPDVDEGRHGISQALSTWAATNGETTPRPAMAMSSADGIVMATEQALLHFAATHMDLASGKALQMHSGEQTSIAAAQGIAMHTAERGITVEAEKGPVVLGAYSDHISLKGKTDVFITAAEGKVQIHAPVIEFISHGGSYLRIGDDVELASPGDVTVKTPNVHVVKEASRHLTSAMRDATQVNPARTTYGNEIHDEPLGARGTKRGRTS